VIDGRRDQELSLVPNSLALIASKVAAMGLGFAFWLVAARFFARDAVGLAAAAVSAMMLATQIAQLGLGSAVISRLPAHRQRPAPLLDAAFNLTAAAGLIAAAVLLAVAAGFSGQLSVVASDPLYAILFTGASLFGTLGILYDQTNTALRRGDQALVRGVVFGAVALAGLVVVALVAGRHDARAIFAPWLFGGLAGAAIGIVQLRRVAGYVPQVRLERATARELLKVGLPNQVLTLAERTPGLVLPILVTELVSPAANAAWYVAWMMAWVVYIVPIQVGMTLFAELAQATEPAAVTVKRAVRTALAVGGLGTVIVLVGAHPVLSLLGGAYAHAGATPLRILVLAVFPLTATAAYFNTCRATGRFRESVAAGWTICLASVGAGAVAAKGGDLEAVAVAWVVVQSIAGVGSALRLRSLLGLRPPRVEFEPVPTPARPRRWRRALGPVPAGMSRVPLVWRLALRRSARQLGARLTDGEELRAVGVACHHRSSGGLAVVDAFARGSGVGLLALSGKRLLFVGHGGWLELPRETLLDAEERQGRFGTRALRLQTAAGDIALDGFGAASAMRWRARLSAASAPPASQPREARPPLGTAALVAARSLPTLALIALAPLSVALWFAVLRDIRPESVGDLGLVTSLPPAAWVALGALVAGFVASLAPERPRLRVAALYIVALVVALYGAIAIIEHTPSYDVTWRHAGIAGVIASNGHIDPSIDAYFNWPGFFALLALITKLTGLSNPIALAAWTPVALNLSYVAALALILRTATRDMRLVLGALWVFALTNWVGQDYLSPQGLDFFLYLVVLALALSFFGGPARGMVSPWMARVRLALGGPDPGRLDASPRQRALLMGIGLAVTGAIVTSHQLTPFALLLSIAALVVCGRSWVRNLPLLIGVMVVAWLLYLAHAYLSGNFDQLTQQIGALGSNVSSSVGQRVGGSSGHTLVVWARLVFSGVLWAFALVGGVRRLRARRGGGSLAVLAIAPFALPLLQAYGGEIALRTYIFAAPFVSFFAASWLLEAKHARRAVVLAVASAVLIGGFAVARYGNAEVNFFTPGEVHAMNGLYALAPPNATLIAPGPDLPWQSERYAEIDWQLISHRLKVPSRPYTDAQLASVVGRVLQNEGDPASFVVITRSLKVYDRMFGAAKWGSVEALERALAASPRFRSVIDEPDAHVFEYLPTVRRNG
jgi:O-antigen/teichoic acid export membrane protein